MVCQDCVKGFELIELPFGSSPELIHSARKTWFKNLHPDVWQNKPGWKGAAKQLTNVNVAIDHLLACDGTSSLEQSTSSEEDEFRKQAEEETEPQVITSHPTDFSGGGFTAIKWIAGIVAALAGLGLLSFYGSCLYVWIWVSTDTASHVVGWVAASPLLIVVVIVSCVVWTDQRA